MKYSRPAKRVKLVSIGFRGKTIDDLLTEKVASKTHWLNTSIAVGNDSWLSPIEHLRTIFAEYGSADFFNEMVGLEGDEVADLYQVGGDGCGDFYVFGEKSQKFYVVYHEPEEFNVVDNTAKSFLQWVIREKSRHLAGCPWEIFAPISKTRPVFRETLYHRVIFDMESLLSKAREILNWDREYISPDGFALWDQNHEVSFRFDKTFWGDNSHFEIVSARKRAKISAFIDWLREQGFGKDYELL